MIRAPHYNYSLLRSEGQEPQPAPFSTTLVFINPRMAEMKNRAPLMEHYGHPIEERVLLPAAYVVPLAFRAGDREQIMAVLPGLTEHHEGEILSPRIAEHEWAHRFKLMVVKRLGPSLVPAEVVVPLKNLGAVMAEIERAVNQPIVKEGLIIREGRSGEPEAVILGFIPSDQRKFSYNFVFGLVLTVIKIAEKHGGRPYATGLYFSSKEVQRQWAVFEAMIALMTPEGFADLMGTMWPELIDAMPFGMGPMMRMMGKVPGALQLMKPMFPILFPRLLPMMMPKVMPTMLDRVAERVPMPDYMAEQMPELMPQVMDNLMPHMIGDVVPLVADPMIAYLRNGRNGHSN